MSDKTAAEGQERRWRVSSYAPKGDGRGNTWVWNVELVGPQPSNNEHLLPVSEHEAALSLERDAREKAESDLASLQAHVSGVVEELEQRRDRSIAADTGPSANTWFGGNAYGLGEAAALLRDVPETVGSSAETEPEGVLGESPGGTSEPRFCAASSGSCSTGDCNNAAVAEVEIEDDGWCPFCLPCASSLAGSYAVKWPEPPAQPEPRDLNRCEGTKELLRDQGNVPCPGCVDCDPSTEAGERQGKCERVEDGWSCSGIEERLKAEAASIRVGMVPPLEGHPTPEAADELLKHQEGECAVPPPGWRCTRQPGHEGPCAAIPTSCTQPVSPEPTHDCDPDWPCSANDHICKNRRPTPELSEEACEHCLGTGEEHIDGKVLKCKTCKGTGQKP